MTSVSTSAASAIVSASGPVTASACPSRSVSSTQQDGDRDVGEGRRARRSLCGPRPAGAAIRAPPVLDPREEGHEVGVHRVPQEGRPHPALPDPLLGREVLADEGEDGVGGGVQERRVDDPLHPRRHRRVDGSEVLLQPVLVLGRRHQVDGVGPRSAASSPAGSSKPPGLATTSAPGTIGCPSRVADDEPERDVAAVASRSATRCPSAPVAPVTAITTGLPECW